MTRTKPTPLPIPPHHTPAALRARAPTLAEALAILPNLDDLPVATHQAWTQNANAFAKRIGLPSSEIYLDPPLLRPLLAAMLPAGERRFSAKRWANIRSSINRIAQRFGWVERFGKNTEPLPSAAWSALIDPLPGSPQKAVMRTFARWCAERQVEPEVVNAATLEEYRQWRHDHTNDVRSNVTVGTCRRHWNRWRLTVPGWPQHQIAPPTDPRVFRDDLSAFAPSFLADIDRYAADLLKPDPMDENRRRGLSPVTISGRRRSLLWAATAVARAGTPLTSITSLADLVTPANLKLALLAHHAALGDKWGSVGVSMGLAFTDYAERHLRLPQAELAAFKQLKRRSRVERTGLSPDTRARVRGLTDDPKVLHTLFQLPKRLADQAERLLAEGRTAKAARLSEVALAMALECSNQLRRRTLSGLCYPKHFTLDDRGVATSFNIPPELTKTRRAITDGIDPAGAQILHRHVRVFRPLLPDVGKSHFLFPSSDPAKPKNEHTLSKGICRIVREAIGRPFNLHDMRHVAATMILNEAPDAIHLVQRKLHHQSYRTTQGMYDHNLGRGADERYAKLLKAALDRASRNAKPSGRGPRRR